MISGSDVNKPGFITAQISRVKTNPFVYACHHGNLKVLPILATAGKAS